MLHHHIDIIQWVSTIGYVGILFIIFAETGLFVGFFLPGDSLLFAAGLLASKNVFNPWFLIPAVIVTAIVGYAVGYWFGRKLGLWLYRREDSLWFKKRYLLQAEQFYNKHGGKALILGRLVPIVRTFVPIVAGMVKMPYRRYLMFNVVGALIWAGGITVLGYYFGNLIPNASRYILLVVLGIIFLSVLPGVWHVVRERFH